MKRLRMMKRKIQPVCERGCRCSPSPIKSHLNFNFYANPCLSLEVEEGQLIETSCVPDITDGTTELAHLQEEINQKGQAATQVPAPFSMATLQSVALDERSKELHIERMAFPTLFPNGSASFNNL